MPTIGELSVGAKYKRQDGTFYLKDGEDIHVKLESDGPTGALIASREQEKFDPKEEVQPVQIVSKARRGPFVDSPVSRPKSSLTKDILLDQIKQEWLEHNSLLQSLRRSWTVTDMDFTYMLTQLRNSGAVVRDRRAFGRKMSFFYKKK